MNKTIICRCEGVCLDQIFQTIEEGANSIQGIKKRNRLGMGFCQGRVCQPVVRDILIDKFGSNTINQIQKAQNPVRPINLGSL